ncbi:DUF1622 domain-containing protein [Nonomuraea sp. ATR24]|uniref:DUF1622 domain-containing protein n=1 Tax=Nonomuraea TaxID=83681 RepID=UPI0027DFBE70|nr:DUF1622 domain-containing protein [Nonomuraea ceibae]
MELQPVKQFIEASGTLLDLLGVLVIVAGTVIASVSFWRRAARQRAATAYPAYRRAVGRTILLGLELLVAADIIKTVAIAPTFQSVGVLAAVVLVRTFLSLSLQVELEGHWPWRNPSPPRDPGT